jgi:hypothetical protein
MMWGPGWGGWVLGFLMMALFWGGLVVLAVVILRGWGGRSEQGLARLSNVPTLKPSWKSDSRGVKSPKRSSSSDAGC